MQAGAENTVRYTTDLERAARFPVTDSLLADVFDGDVVVVSVLSADPRFVRSVRYRDQLLAAGVRSAIFVPLLVGSRVIGDLSAASPRPMRNPSSTRSPGSTVSVGFGTASDG